MHSYLKPAFVAPLLCTLAACGEGSATKERPDLVVSAAASLAEAVGQCARSFDPARVRLSFGGSDELAAQIRQGLKPDVFAAANMKLPKQLASEGLVGTPTQFASNTLVLAVPSDSKKVTGLDDLTVDGVSLAVGSESVPIGSYTRKVLARLAPQTRSAIEGQIRSNEPDVKGIVGKLTQGAVDAGFVYRTDVTATDGALRAIELPPRLQPEVSYGAAVVKGAKNPKGAAEFIDDLRDGDCADSLKKSGFGPAMR